MYTNKPPPAAWRNYAAADRMCNVITTHEPRNHAPRLPSSTGLFSGMGCRWGRRAPGSQTKEQECILRRSHLHAASYPAYETSHGVSTTGLVQLVVAPSQYAHNLGPRCPRRICSVNERGDVSGQSVHGNMGHGGWLRRGDQISGVSRNEAATKRRKNHRISLTNDDKSE